MLNKFSFSPYLSHAIFKLDFVPILLVQINGRYTLLKQFVLKTLFSRFCSKEVYPPPHIKRHVEIFVPVFF